MSAEIFEEEIHRFWQRDPIPEESADHIPDDQSNSATTPQELRSHFANHSTATPLRNQFVTTPEQPHAETPKLLPVTSVTYSQNRS